MSRDDWSRGYFCAVAMAAKSEGIATTLVRELFDGNHKHWESADEEDKEILRSIGLIPEQPPTPPHDQS